MSKKGVQRHHEPRRHAGAAPRRPRPAVEERSGGALAHAPRTVEPVREPVRDVIPHDPALLETSRELWLDADWSGVVKLAPDQIAHHPDRARLLALSATAALQLGDRGGARAQALRALQSGVDRHFLAQALLAGARHTLGRASLFARHDKQADAHFEKALPSARLSSEVRRLSQARRDRAASELRAAVSAATTLRKAGAAPASIKAPGWLSNLAQRCLAASDVHDSVDQALANNVSTADDKVLFLMLLADGFLARNDRMTTLHFLRQASQHIAEAEPALRSELARKLMAVDGASSAVDLFINGALAGSLADPTDRALAASMQSAYNRMRDAAQAKSEHGHEVLMVHLDKHLAAMQAEAGNRKLTLIEVGTTREDVPGQGSTRKLAEYCLRHRLNFVTVDMDPHNSRMARETFANVGATDFEAVTMKGEDYLRDLNGSVDLIFLDAYDFDHGKHSELRQSRYEKYLGSRIDELACHQMHLDCAQTLVQKLSPAGLICFDDTWLDDGLWTAKGTTAMPFLLANGFEVVEARNRAALLRRQRTTASGAAQGATQNTAAESAAA